MRTGKRTNKKYQAYLDKKRIQVAPSGFEVPEGLLHPDLFLYQNELVRWSLQRGKSAIFADCGLGKTIIQLVWADYVSNYTDKPVLILAPLAVSHQTAREGERFGIPVTICRRQEDVREGINIANYEMLSHFDATAFGGLVLDESSILKAFDGITRKELTEFALQIQYRLACTATPAPNDLIELTNHAEFLSIMQGKEIVALFFTQDGNTTHKWRLKGHAKKAFWEWMGTWSRALRKPSDLGFPDDGFNLPALQIHQAEVRIEHSETTLFPMEALTLQERQQARRESIEDRVKACAERVNNSKEPWVIWCNLNAESEALAKAIPDAIEVRGSHSTEYKEKALLGFADGKHRVLISKPSICGFGMNWQHCAKMAFVGLSDSYEQLYQAIRRCWRFGQLRPVDVYIITAETEGAVVKNIQRKERQAAEMMDGIVKHMRKSQSQQAERDEMEYKENVASGQGWTVHLGDSVLLMDRLEDNSVGLTVTSPPFPGMYTYTNSAHDIGNTNDIDAMIDHFRYLVEPQKLLRVTMPGRLCCVHLMQLTAMKSREGYIGIKDYRGRVIAMMQEEGWIYTGEVTIDKNPQIQATRNKERGLLFKSLATDSAMMRMALADYLLYFRKPGENPHPIRAGISQKYNSGGGWITEKEWIEWAAPVWYRQTRDYPGGIRETDVLNVTQARETDDERHLCPLQLGVIERAVKLWSNPGDLILDPFNGIGSVGYQSILLNRRYVGFELKESYWKNSQRNLEKAVFEARQQQRNLFDLLESEEEESEAEELTIE